MVSDPNSDQFINLLGPNRWVNFGWVLQCLISFLAIKCVFIHTCMHASIHTYVHPYIHTSIRPYVRTYVRTYIRTYITLRYITLPYVTLHYITYIHPCMHTYIHPYIFYIHIHTLTLTKKGCARADREVWWAVWQRAEWSLERPLLASPWR